MLEDLLAVLGVDVVDVRVGVGRHDRCVFVLREQLQHFVVVGVIAVAEGNVNAQDHHFILRNIAQVLLQPFVLLGAETAGVTRALLTFVDDVVHRYDMHVAAVERIVHRTEEAFVFRAGLLLVGRREFVVVVADGREYGDSRLFGLQGHHHVAVERPFVVHQVAEVDGVARDVGRGGILPDVLGRFALEPDGVRRLVDLGVADADQIEPGFGSVQRRQREVVAGGFRFEFGEELGQFVGLVHVDLVARRQGVEDEARFRVAGQHILALGVGLRAGEAVADDNPRNGVAVCARDISVGVAAVGNDLSAVSAVIVIAVAVRAGRENRDRAEEKQQSV